jgi:hypothetical protein
VVLSALERRRRQQQPIRRWTRRLVAGDVEVYAADGRARILDMSYGGVRLAFDASHAVPRSFEIRLPLSGVTVRAHRVWMAPSGTTDQCWCGAELEDGDTHRHWRTFVDSLEHGR